VTGTKRVIAVIEFRVALACDPTDRKTHLELADLFHRLGQLPAAIEHYSAVLALEPGDRAIRRRLALLAGDDGQSGDATLP